MSWPVPADCIAGSPAGSEVMEFMKRLVGQLMQRSSVLRGSGCGNGVLLGRVGGTKSWGRAWSSGGLGGPGDTGLDAAVIIETNSTAAFPSSSCMDWALSARGTWVSIVSESARLPSWPNEAGVQGGSILSGSERVCIAIQSFGGSWRTMAEQQDRSNLR